MKEIKENYKGKDRELLSKLIEEIQSRGYDVKINVYKQGRKELRIIAK